VPLTAVLFPLPRLRGTFFWVGTPRFMSISCRNPISQYWGRFRALHAEKAEAEGGGLADQMKERARKRHEELRRQMEVT
jgi:hypothetical protein